MQQLHLSAFKKRLLCAVKQLPCIGYNTNSYDAFMGSCSGLYHVLAALSDGQVDVVKKGARYLVVNTERMIPP